MLHWRNDDSQDVLAHIFSKNLIFWLPWYWALIYAVKSWHLATITSEKSEHSNQFDWLLVCLGCVPRSTNVCKWWFENKEEESCHGLIWGDIPAFILGDWGKRQKPLLELAILIVRIRIETFQNRNRLSNHLIKTIGRKTTPCVYIPVEQK
jgi:hypothetical protein